MNYVRTTAARYGIDKHVKHHHKVLKMDWKSEHQYWAVDVTVNRIEQKIFYARYLVLGTGYYDYNAGLAAVIPGLKNFKGTVVHHSFGPKISITPAKRSSLSAVVPQQSRFSLP